jgi:hypothetical protein
LDEVHRLVAFWSAVDVKHCLILCSGRSSPNRHRHQTVTIEQTLGRSPSASRLEGRGKSAPALGFSAGRANRAETKGTPPLLTGFLSVVVRSVGHLNATEVVDLSPTGTA